MANRKVRLNIKLILILFYFISLFLIACGNRNEQDIRAFELEDIKFYAAYLNGDINTAENVLLQYIEVIHEYKKKGVKGFNFDTVEGLTKIRLYLIKKEKGHTKEANNYLDKSLNLLINSIEKKEGRELSIEEVELEKNKIIRFVEETDIKNSARWLPVNKIILDSET